MENRKPSTKQTFYYINASSAELIEYLIKINSNNLEFVELMEKGLEVLKSGLWEDEKEGE